MYGACAAAEGRAAAPGGHTHEHDDDEDAAATAFDDTPVRGGTLPTRARPQWESNHDDGEDNSNSRYAVQGTVMHESH